VNSRPFTDITTNAVGDFTGASVAAGNGFEAGVGSLFGFDAVFTANFVAAAAGNVSFHFYSDDGFIFGAGGGAERVSGAFSNPPNETPLEHYPVMGAYNQPTAPVGNEIVVHFPKAGTYPYEVDYSECCGGQLAMTMSGSSGLGVPPAGNLSLTPVNVPTQTVGQPVHLTVAAMDASGNPIPSLPITMTVSGVNSQTVTGTTDSKGLAVLSYTGTHEGSDLVLVGASVSGAPAVSNTIGVFWKFGSGTSSESPPPLVTHVEPEDGKVITQPTPIKAKILPPEGQTIESWKVTAKARNPEPEIVIASGEGPPKEETLGTLDTTALANDTYEITISAKASGGGTESSTTTVAVQGDYKPGRYVTSYQDLSVPVNGFQMNVRRVYDSIDKRVGDFGVGWHVELANFRVSTNRELGAGGWTEYPKSCVFGLCFWGFKTSTPHYVTVTYPDGHQEIFDFTPEGGAALLYTEGTALFTGRATNEDPKAELEPEGGTGISYQFDGNLYGSSGIYNPTRFRLTTHDGRVLVLDTAKGLISESDKSGNALTIDENGVHSTLGPAPGTPGPSITFKRDPQGRIEDIFGPRPEEQLHYTYENGNLRSVADPNGNTTTYSYDSSSGNLASVIGPNNQPVETIRYDGSGHVISIANGSEPPTTISTNISGRQETLFDPAGKLTTILTYDERGDITERDQSFNGKTLKSTFTYDPVGRLTSATDPLSGKLSETYDESTGDVLSVTDAAGRTWRLENYNSLGEPGQLRRPDGSVDSSFTYDASTGKLLSDQAPGAAPTVRTYWPSGQLKSVTDPGGRALNLGYDSAGNLATISDGAGHTVHLTINTAGQLAAIQDQLGNTTRLAYTPDGQLSQLTDPNGSTYSYYYDALDRLHQVEDPLHRSSFFGYNSVGELSSRTDRNGAVTTYAYDADGHLNQETRPGGEALNFTYDPLGRLVEADDAASHIDRSYTDTGWLTSEASCANTGSPSVPCGAAASPTQPIETLDYSYGPDGEVQSVSNAAAGTVRYGYDSNGRLSSVEDPSQGLFSFGYDPFGRLASLARPNGVDDSFAYTASGDLRSLDAKLHGNTVASFEYQIDPVTGEITALTDSSGTHTFTYDAKGQLKSATHPASSGLANETYSYDPAGNRTSGTGINGTATYDASDRLLTDGNFNYTYDNEGNLSSKTPVGGGPSSTYEWNADHQLTSIHYPDGSSASYSYDPFGRRVRVVDHGADTRLVYNGLNPYGDYNATNQLRTSYVTSLGVDSALEMTERGLPSYFVSDGLGSTRALTDGSGAITGRYSYDSFGRPGAGNASPSRYTFTGDQYDASSDLYEANARYYDPATGRFISEDPIHHINPFTYANNDPVDYVDPTGSQAFAEYSMLVKRDVEADPGLAKIGLCTGLGLVVGFTTGNADAARALATGGIVSGFKDFYSAEVGPLGPVFDTLEGNVNSENSIDIAGALNDLFNSGGAFGENPDKFDPWFSLYDDVMLVKKYAELFQALDPNADPKEMAKYCAGD
jgi:RHS repeat-associated protein